MLLKMSCLLLSKIEHTPYIIKKKKKKKKKKNKTKQNINVILDVFVNVEISRFLKLQFSFFFQHKQEVCLQYVFCNV